MKPYRMSLVALMGLALVVTGCGKKATDQANLSGTGFDSLTTTEELAQLPQSNASNQQAAIEVLPIETSPVTQGVPIPANLATASTSSFDTTATSAVSTGSLSRQQQIQTALKNAGLYQGAIDGKIGPASKRAIETFQSNNGLKVDGKVGPKTWAVLETYLNGQAGTAQSTGTTTAAE